MENRELLIESGHGVYAWDILLKTYKLFIGKEKIPFDAQYISSVIPGENMSTVFNPENENWCENVVYFEDKGLFVQLKNGSFAHIYQDEDIWMIHPDSKGGDKK